MRFTSLALAAVMLFPAMAHTADLPKTLMETRQQIMTADYRLSGHLVRVDESGARTSYGVNIKAHWFPEVLRVLLEVGSPATARVHVLLEMHPGGITTIKVAHHGDASATALPFDKWTTGPLGDAFSYEDFIDSSYFWPGQTDLGEAKFGARNCQLLKSTPGAEDKTHYAQVKSWLDLGSAFPVYVEKTLKGSGTVKEFTYFGLRKTEGVWSATQVEAKIHGHSGSTLLIIEHGAAKAHLDAKDFDSAQLTHF
jgi:hypothetical protein